MSRYRFIKEPNFTEQIQWLSDPFQTKSVCNIQMDNGVLLTACALWNAHMIHSNNKYLLNTGTMETVGDMGGTREETKTNILPTCTQFIF